MFVHFYVIIDTNMKSSECYEFFVLFTVLCFDSLLNLLKRVTDGSFLFLCKTLVLFFLPFLNLGAQIRYPQNWFFNPTSVLDQPLALMLAQSH